MKRSLLVAITLSSAAVSAQSGAGAPARSDLVARPSPGPTKITSIDAKPLINGLRLASVKSSKVKTKTTWTLKTLSCATQNGDELTGFDTTTCQTDGKKITGAAAVVLMKGMQDAKIPQPYRMGGALIEASGVSCAWETDVSKGGDDGPFACTYSPPSH